MSGTRKMMLMAATVLGAMPSIAGLPECYQPRSTADSLTRASKVDRSKIKAARKQNSKRRKPKKGGDA